MTSLRNHNNSTAERQETTSSPDYLCGSLMKKVDVEEWTEYWVVLEGTTLMCYDTKHNTKPLIGWIELTRDTRYSLGREKKRSFPFCITKEGKRYLFETECPESRNRWSSAIKLCIRGLTYPAEASETTSPSDKFSSETLFLDDMSDDLNAVNFVDDESIFEKSLESIQPARRSWLYQKLFANPTSCKYVNRDGFATDEVVVRDENKEMKFMPWYT